MAPGPRRRLIVVANRAPATYDRATDGSRIARRGGGGLVTALRGLLAHHDVTWIASAMSEEDRVVSTDNNGSAFTETSHEGASFRLRLIAHDPAAYDAYYNVVANPTLWFVHHYLWNFAATPVLDESFRRAWRDGYAHVNESFADAVVDELSAQPDATVFFHDYHLYLAPQFVRAARPKARLQHFVHIPWPQPDYWRALPGDLREAIHAGVLANDAVGFHTHRWQRAFVDCCRDFLGVPCDRELGEIEHQGRRVRVTANPISVDVTEFEQLAGSDDVLAAERELLRARPERLVLRVDRTDPSKNVVRGIRAFELYLDAHPDAHGRVGMLALLTPSRQDVPEYAAYARAIEEAAAQVNARYARDDWRAVDVRIQDSFPSSVAAYKHYDVLLVNAVYDGLNLVAKEAPLVNTRDGVVILSENAGSHEELEPHVLTVNPFDVAGQAEAIHAALTLTADERRARTEGIRGVVRAHDLGAWLEVELAALDHSTGGI